MSNNHSENHYVSGGMKYKIAHTSAGHGAITSQVRRFADRSQAVKLKSVSSFSLLGKSRSLWQTNSARTSSRTYYTLRFGGYIVSWRCGYELKTICRSNGSVSTTVSR